MKKRDEGQIQEVEERLMGKSALLLFLTFLIVGVVFYVSLSMVKSGENIGGASGSVTLSPGEKKDFNFGISEILSSMAFAFLITGFLIWAKSMILKNPYLGAAIGIIGAGIIGYGFSLKYWGPYSLGFMAVSGLIVIGYLGANFFKYIKKDKLTEEFDDN